MASILADIALCALQEEGTSKALFSKFGIGRIKAWQGRVAVKEVFAMPRYFFHVRRGQLTVIDREGTELNDLTEVAREAARRGRDVATREAMKGIPPQGGLIIVDDEWEERVFELPFEDIAG